MELSNLSPINGSVNTKKKELVEVKALGKVALQQEDTRAQSLDQDTQKN